MKSCFFPPQVVWFFEDEPITTTTGSEIQIETTENYTALRIPKAKRYHDEKVRQLGITQPMNETCAEPCIITYSLSPGGTVENSASTPRTVSKRLIHLTTLRS